MSTVICTQLDVHPLRAWRMRHGITLRALADMIEDATGRSVTHASLSRVEGGKQDPSCELMRGIYSVTNGEVTPNDLLGAEPQAAGATAR